MEFVVDHMQVQGKKDCSPLPGSVYRLRISDRESDLNYFYSWIIVTCQLAMFTQTTKTSPSGPDVEIISTITLTCY